jgi:hypothetical protein
MSEKYVEALKSKTDLKLFIMGESNALHKKMVKTMLAELESPLESGFKTLCGKTYKVNACSNYALRTLDETETLLMRPHLDRIHEHERHMKELGNVINKGLNICFNPVDLAYLFDGVVGDPIGVNVIDEDSKAVLDAWSDRPQLIALLQETKLLYVLYGGTL